MSFQIVLNILLSASIYLLIGQSFKFLYETSRFIVISHAISLTLAGYFQYFFTVQVGMTYTLAIPISISVVILVTVIIFNTIYQPLIRRNVEPFLILIASLGIYMIFENLIKIFWGDDTKSILQSFNNSSINIFGGYLTDLQLCTILVCTLLVIIAILFQSKTTLGKRIKAISSNLELSQIYGINHERTMLLSFIVGTILIGVAGILLAYDISLTPSMGFNYLLYGIVALIIGGMGSTKGLVGGAFLLAGTQHLGAYFISSSWKEAIAYIILVVFLVFRPFGFSGKQLKKIRI